MLVGTRKGAFILTSDEARQQWSVDHVTLQRRAFVRFFACRRDLSLQSPDVPLPASVADGREPLLIVGAMAGG